MRVLRLSAALALVATLSACVAGQNVMQETTRSLARTAVDGAVRQYLPGVNVTPYTNCVIDNANTAELLQLANAAASGANGAGEAWPVVRNIASRVEVQTCLMQAAQSNPLEMLR